MSVERTLPVDTTVTDTRPSPRTSPGWTSRPSPSRGVTNEIVASIEATIVSPTRGLIIGTADLTWADYGVDTPATPVATVADAGTLEFQLVISQQS